MFNNSIARLLGAAALMFGGAPVDDRRFVVPPQFTRPTFGKRDRSPGPRRPAGAKLARKAAAGRIGMGHPQ